MYKKKSCKACKARKTVKIAVAAGICLTLIIGVFAAGSQPSLAERPSAAEVENSTLVIGTHLIYLDALTPQIYQIANASADSSGQRIIYYKSELDAGVWYDITDAKSIYDFSSAEGKAVENRLIDGLILTHHTKPDGKTYDLSTGKPVAPVDIADPYDIRELPELAGVKSMHDSLDALKSKDKAAKDKLAMLKKILELTPKKEGEKDSAKLEDLDRQIKGMSGYIDYLHKSETASKAMILIAEDMQTKLDSARREIVYQKVYDALQEQILEAGQTSGSRGTVYSDVVELLSGVQSAVEQARTGYENDMPAAGQNPEDRVRYEKTMDMVKKALSVDYPGADRDLRYLEDLENIDMKQVVNKSRERTVAQELSEKFFGEYRELLRQGVSVRFEEAKGSGEAFSVLQNLNKEQETLLNGTRTAYQDMTEAVTLRTDEGSQAAYLAEQLSRVSSLKAEIRDDEMKVTAENNVEQAARNLNGQLGSVYKNDGQKSEVQKLQDQLKSLKEKYKSALDKDDLEEAARLESQISNINEKIQEKSSAVIGEINGLQEKSADMQRQIDTAADPVKKQELLSAKASVDAEITHKKSGLASQDTSVMEVVGSLKEEAERLIARGELSEANINAISANITGILGYLPDYAYLAYPALQQIGKAFDDSVLVRGPLPQALYEAKSMVADALKSYREVYENGITGSVDAADVSFVLEEWLASVSGGTESGDGTGLSHDSAAAAAMAALDRLYENRGKDSSILLLANDFAAAETENPLVCNIVYKNRQYYAPVTAVSRYLRYRLVTDDDGDTQILAQGPIFYKFRAGKSKVEKGKGIQLMNGSALKYGNIYIDGDYIKKEFGLTVCPMLSTGRSVLLDEAALKAADELYDSISI